MAKLCLLDENGAMAGWWEVGDRPLAVGRDDSADIVIEDESLSGRHFVVCWRDGRYQLEDLNSRNGTWVDGKPARTVHLRDNVCIAAGRTLFLFSENPHKVAARAA